MKNDAAIVSTSTASLPGNAGKTAASVGSTASALDDLEPLRNDDQRQQMPVVERAGAWLWESHRNRRPFSPLPADLAPRDATDAYAIQRHFVGLRTAALGATVGYKIALTTPAMRAMVGLTDSIAGELLEKSILRSPARVRADDHQRLLVECEIAVQIAEDLPAGEGPFDRARVTRAVATVMPAFELADDRHADYSKLSMQALMLIADNAWNEGVVLGRPVPDWTRIDLGALRGIATINGIPVGEGHGRDVLGHPFEAVVWIANHLAARGRSLSRGDIVITGSLVTSKFPKAGDVVRFEAGELGSVELRVD